MGHIHLHPLLFFSNQIAELLPLCSNVGQSLLSTTSCPSRASRRMASLYGKLPVANVGSSPSYEVFRYLQKRNISWLKQEPAEGFGFFRRRNQNVRGLNGCSEGKLAARNPSFVAGQPGDHSIRKAVGSVGHRLIVFLPHLEYIVDDTKMYSMWSPSRSGVRSLPPPVVPWVRLRWLARAAPAQPHAGRSSEPR